MRSLLNEHCSTVKLTIHDPLYRPVESEYLVSEDGHTAYVEVANSSGLQMLALTERDPWKASSCVSNSIFKNTFRVWGKS